MSIENNPTPSVTEEMIEAGVRALNTDDLVFRDSLSASQRAKVERIYLAMKSADQPPPHTGPISSRELIQRCGQDPDKPLTREELRFPPEMRMRPATDEEAQRGLNDTWPGDPIPAGLTDVERDVRHILNRHLPLITSNSQIAIIANDIAALLVSDRSGVERLQRALIDHNDRLRSACAIAHREGRDTNWLSFRGQVHYTLAEHQEVTNEARAALDTIPEKDE